MPQTRFFACAGEFAVFAEHGDQLTVNTRRARQAFLLMQKVSFAREVAHQATRLSHEKGASCHIPRRQTSLKKTFGEAGRHVGQIQGCGTGAT